MEEMWKKATRVFALLDLIWSIVLMVYMILAVNISVPEYLLSRTEGQVVFAILCTIQIYGAARLFVATLSETSEIQAVKHVKTWIVIYMIFTMLYFTVMCCLMYFYIETEDTRTLLQFGAAILLGRVAGICLVLKFKTVVLKQISTSDKMFTQNDKYPRDDFV